MLLYLDHKAVGKIIQYEEVLLEKEIVFYEVWSISLMGSLEMRITVLTCKSLWTLCYSLRSSTRS